MKQNTSLKALAFFCLLGMGASHAATLVVDDKNDPGTADDGQCALREAINAINNGAEDADDCLNTSANGFGTSDEIRFDAALSGDEIDLNGTELPQITVGVAIAGPVALDPAGITIDGENNSRILNIDSTVPVSLSNLTLRRGRTTADTEGGGALRSQNVPLLSLADVVIKNSSTEGLQSSGGAVFAVDGNVNLLRTTFSDNKTTGPGADGGALFLLAGDLDMKHSQVIGNSTEGVSSDGGGLYIRAGTAVITSSTLKDNLTRGDMATGGALSVLEATVNLGASGVMDNHTEGEQASGGALYAIDSIVVLLPNTTIGGNHTQGDHALGGGLAVQSGQLQVSSSRVTDNSTAGLQASGGGIYAGDNTTLGNSMVSGNSTSGESAAGGGVYFRSDATLFDSVISGNSTSGVEAPGGGLRLQMNADNATLNNVSIIDNQTTGLASQGGGLSLTNGDASVTNSTVSGNSTTANMSSGGGVAVSFGTTRVVNSTISGNTIQGNDAQGGGMHVAHADIVMTHVTLADNVADKTDSDGLFVDPADMLTLNNSLVVQSGGGDVACNEPADTAVNSLATDASCGTGVETATNINLQPLAFNGGTTQTHALGFPSAAITNGAPNDALCMDALPDGAGGRDQRGVPRPTVPAANQCDLGAYEGIPELDQGDAPTAGQSGFADSYPTLLADNGAAHALATDGHLGSSLDSDEDGMPTEAADGDDNTFTDDEDGVFFTSAIESGNNATVDITVINGDGLLNAWMDFNMDGDWDDAGEQIFNNEFLMTGSNAGLTFAVPADAMAGESFARFRFDTGGNLTPRGIAANGEVEDYQVFIGPEPTVMFNDEVMNPDISESAGTFVVEDAVLLSNPSSQTITVDIMFDAGASDAMIPDDFDFAPATVTFAPGETSADLEVMIVDDGVDEPEESGFFNLMNPVGATLGNPATFQATLKDPKKGGGGGGSSGSGCSIGDGQSRFDPLLPLLLMLAALFAGMREIKFPKQRSQP